MFFDKGAFAENKWIFLDDEGGGGGRQGSASWRRRSSALAEEGNERRQASGVGKKIKDKRPKTKEGGRSEPVVPLHRCTVAPLYR